MASSKNRRPLAKILDPPLSYTHPYPRYQRHLLAAVGSEACVTYTIARRFTFPIIIVYNLYQKGSSDYTVYTHVGWQNNE